MANADMFLSVEGARTGVIKGEANAPDHLDEIEITGWEWGMSGSSALGGVPPTPTTAAAISWPNRRSGTPYTPASTTPGCCSSTRSTSSG